jgi:hypothetical protein
MLPEAKALEACCPCLSTQETWGAHMTASSSYISHPALRAFSCLQARGSAGLEAYLASKKEDAKPEFLKQRPKYYYYYEWTKKRIGAQVCVLACEASKSGWELSTHAPFTANTLLPCTHLFCAFVAPLTHPKLL